MNENSKDKSLVDMYEDEMMKEFYEEYIVKKNWPDEDEAVQNLNFFAVFAIGCMKVAVDVNGEVVSSKMLEVAQKFKRRTDTYALLLRKCGFKSGRYFVGRKAKDFNDVLSRAFYGIET